MQQRFLCGHPAHNNVHAPRSVEQGGTLLADGLCGYKDEDGNVRDPATSPLNAIFGSSVADIEAVPDDKPPRLDDPRLPVWFLKVVFEPAAGTQTQARW